VRGLAPLLSFLALFAACAVAPAESPDDVVARENARVNAAKRRAEDQDKKHRDDADKRRQADEQARIATEQDEQARKTDAQRRASSEKEASCGSDRAERRRHIQDAVDRAAKDRARAAELDSYIAKSCTRKEVPDYDNQQYVDERGYVRTRQVQVSKHDEIACPPDAPPELRPGGSGIPSGVVQIQATAEERAKNDRCQDVQDLLRK
jgi:hypothetical protein